MIYIDTNVFAYAILGNKNAKEILINVVTGKLAACTSLLTWDELIWAIKRAIGRYDLAKIEGKKFMFFPKLKFLELNFEVVKLAQELISEDNLDPRDALHMATALNKGVNEIISDDADLDRVKNIKRIAINRFNP